jgi:hypothetical protein
VLSGSLRAVAKATWFLGGVARATVSGSLGGVARAILMLTEMD